MPPPSPPLRALFRRLRANAAAALVALVVAAAPAKADDLLVFAAASLKDVVDDAAAAWREETGGMVVASFAGSAQLARQVENGAPADVFISASVDWVDYLSERGALDEATRRSVAGNSLVVVAPRSREAAASGGAPPVIDAGFNLAKRLGDGRLAVALVDAVPAGIYAKAALRSIGLWTAAAPRLAETDNVRAALALVSRGEAPLGVVYASDVFAGAEGSLADVAVVGRFASTSHPPIAYVAAVSTETDAAAAATAFVDFLAGPSGRALFARRGFTAPPE